MSVILTLKDVAETSENVLDEALMIYRTDKNKRFLFVEGGFDRKFLICRGYEEQKYYYLGMTGKSNVIMGYKTYISDQTYSNLDKICFLVDLDYDHVLGDVISGDKIKYFSYCNVNGCYQYNDVEGFLINSNSFYKFCVDYNLHGNLDDIRSTIELESRRVGKYRAANELLKKKYVLDRKDTILASFEIQNFLDEKNFLFLERSFESYQRINTKHKEYIDELFVEAQSINEKNDNKWSLSRGHDITEFLSLYIYFHRREDFSADEIEKILRIGVENHDFESCIIGKKLIEIFSEC